MSDLKSWRNARSLTQSDLADLLGTNVPNVSRIETGNQWPGPELMAAIEAVTKGEVTASHILEAYRSKRASAAAE